MALSEGLIRIIEQSLSEKFKSNVQIKYFTPIGGGCINESYQLQTSAGSFFFKWNNAEKYPHMFEAEAKGLSLLQSANALKIPGVNLVDEAEGKSFLILEYIETGRRQSGFWKDFGTKLAKLHQASPTPPKKGLAPPFGGRGAFGLDHDNYIGSLPQSNNQHSSWIGFFIHERIEPQLKLALEAHSSANLQINKFSNLFKRLPEIIPDEKPALLHGDLWNGNYLVSENGSACLIDPAVYYGHREMDLAMTRLFGGFDDEFYEAYDEEFPLTPGFDSRVDIHNLYPLLVHVNLFGGGYVHQVKSILSRF